LLWNQIFYMINGIRLMFYLKISLVIVNNIFVIQICVWRRQKQEESFIENHVIMISSAKLGVVIQIAVVQQYAWIMFVSVHMNFLPLLILSKHHTKHHHHITQSHHTMPCYHTILATHQNIKHHHHTMQYHIPHIESSWDTIHQLYLHMYS